MSGKQDTTSCNVTIENESIYGDGVNMASRIESLAASGNYLMHSQG